EGAGGMGDVELFVDLSEIVGVMSAKGGQQFAAGAAILGLNSFQSAGLSVAFNRDEFEAMSQLLLITEGQSALFNLFNLPVKPMKGPEPFVPAAIVNYSTVNWNVDLFYSTLTGLVNAVNPNGMEQVDAMLAGPDPEKPLVNLRNDVVKPLGDRISFASDMIEAEGLPVSRVCMFWSLDDSTRFKELIERLLALGGEALPLQKKSVKGNTVYTFPAGDMLAAQMPMQGMALPIDVIGFTVTKTHFMLATHVEILDQMLNAEEGAGLAESPKFRKIAAKLPEKVSGFTFVDSEAQSRAGYDAFASGKVAEQLEKALEQNEEAGELLSGFVEVLKGEDLPEFDEIKKYFTPGGSYVVMNESGVRIVQFTLKK
ncbi:MAG: hypothetical protein ACRC1K_20135, partial [Planctomycetia bacterium]